MGKTKDEKRNINIIKADLAEALEIDFLRISSDEESETSESESEYEECRESRDGVDQKAFRSFTLSEEDLVKSSKTKVSRSDFTSLKVLGTGAYGKVYLVKKLSGNDAGVYYAMKVLKKANLVYLKQESKFKKIANSPSEAQIEKNILKQVCHPFIVELHYAFQTPERIYLILDYIPGGELFHYLAQERIISEEDAAFYLAQVVLAIEHLHSCGVIYRDLKPENILLDEHGYIKLTDFGLSKVPLDGRTGTRCGTIEYMPPEIVNERQYTQTVDWWSVGILAFDMIVGNVRIAF
jgi:p90 ribosomal S6 kinase